MPEAPVRIRIPGLSRAEFLELAESIDPAEIDEEEAQVGDERFGDLGLTTAIVLLSIPALKGLVAYLAYRHRGTSFERTVEYEDPDGRRVKETVRWRDTSSEPVDAALAEQLGTATGIDPALLLPSTP